MLSLSIIASLFTIPLIVSSGIGSGRHSYRDDIDADKIIHGFLVLIGLTQMVVAIMTSAFSCRVVCGRSNNKHATVIFAPLNTADPNSIIINTVPINTNSNPIPNLNIAAPNPNQPGHGLNAEVESVQTTLDGKFPNALIIPLSLFLSMVVFNHILHT